MNRLEVAGVEDALSLAPRLRAADVAELQEMFPGTPEDALVLGIALSSRAWTWHHGDEVVMVGGVQPHPLKPGVGVPWALGSELVRVHKDYWLSQAPVVVGWMHDLFPVLENHVDSRNHAAIGWLVRAGFTLHDAVPLRPGGVPFHRFTKEKPPCAPP